MNPALWAETFQDDEDFYEAGYQLGNEVELFVADEAGQAAKTRLALLELAAAKPGPENSLVSYSLTPSSSPSPAPPEDSPTADDLLAHANRLQLQNYLQIAASSPTVVGECWPVRDRVIQRKEPSLVHSGTKPPSDDHLTRLEHLYPGANGEIANPVAGEDRQPEGPLLMKKEEPSLIRKAKYNESLWLGGDHFWPIFEGPSSVAIKRDEPDRMPDAPVSGDGADGKIQMCCFWW